MATVGTGKYTYEIVEGWGSLPQGWELGQTAIVTDSQDRVYLFNRSDHPLIVLDRDGNFLSAWGEGVLTDAHGMFIDAEDNLYLPVKNNHVVLKYSSQGNLLMSLGTRDQPSDTGWSGNISDPVQRAASAVQPPHRRCPFSRWRPVHFRRLRQLPGPQVHRRGRVALFVGRAGENRSRSVSRPPWRMGAHRRQGLCGRPGKRPGSDF